MSSPLVVTVTRSGQAESEHLVDVAVVDAAGVLVGLAGDPQRQAYFRSAAKLMQACATVDDGAADAAGFDAEALALACASHNAEEIHLAVVDQMLRGCGCTEADLACGPHPSLASSVSRARIKAGVTLTPRHNNCSGKHAAMLALAKHRGFSFQGYERPEHPVQQRLLDEIVRFCGVDRGDVGVGVDNCRACTFRVSLSAMARAWAFAGSTDDMGPRRLREAMWTHPHLVAGTSRACTTFLDAAPGRLLVKVGAEGIYCAAVVDRGVGVALKVRSGDPRAAHIALAHVLVQLDGRLPGQALPHERWHAWARLDNKDTRGDVVGAVAASGDMVWR
jgi:L-asparaginase II